MATASVIKIRRRPPDMGRITTQVLIENTADPAKSVQCVALIDTGASHMVLPLAWKDRLGKLESIGPVEAEVADQSFLRGEMCGPVKITVERFRSVFSEVIFLDMQPSDGEYEPLLGYLVLEAIPAAVDMLGHRLVPVKHLDLK